MNPPARGAAVFVRSSRLWRFVLSPDHPFKPERSELAYDMCASRGLLSGPGVRVEEIEQPEEGLLETFHTREYLDVLSRAQSGREVDVEMLRHGVGTVSYTHLTLPTKRIV